MRTLVDIWTCLFMHGCWVMIFLDKTAEKQVHLCLEWMITTGNLLSLLQVNVSIKKALANAFFFNVVHVQM